jgi:ABC-type transport system substrate-binding protein
LPEGSDVRTRNGVELRLTLLTDQDPLRALISQAIAEQLAEVGISVTLASEESTDLIRNFLIPRQYQAALFGWDPDRTLTHTRLAQLASDTAVTWRPTPTNTPTS